MTWKFLRKKKLATQKGKKLRKESGNAFVAKPRLFSPEVIKCLSDALEKEKTFVVS